MSSQLHLITNIHQVPTMHVITEGEKNTKRGG